MLRIVESSSAGQAKSYYKAADYYIEGQEQELTGQWRGRAAAMLGLAGEINQADWSSLCDNLDPRTGEKLTVRQKDNRRVGYDFNFHVPKSVSLLYAMSSDERLLDAFRDAVHETMQEIEADMKTRVRRGGMDDDRVTGNLAWGEFIHFTSRPVDGIPDPHLHAHCFVHNLTFDAEENRWKAGQFGDIKRDAGYYEGRFQARLGFGLMELGLHVQPTATGWEVAGISKDTLERFSRRTKQIEDHAARRGIVDPDVKAGLGAKTRERKAKHMTLDSLRTVWSARLSESDHDAIVRTREKIGRGRVGEDRESISALIALAADHVFERSAVSPERRVMAEAFKRTIGKGSLKTIEQEFARKGFISAIRKGQKILSTRQVLAEEKSMLDFARAGRGTCKPLARGQHQPLRQWLNQDQKRAVEHVLNSRDRVTVVRGVAGVGKTSFLQEVADWAERHGQKIFPFAPSARASRGALRGKGFAQADTVAMLKSSRPLQERVRGSVIWIDEAGLMGTREMAGLFTLAESLDARVVLAGDRFQHSSVARGSALRLLETDAGLVPIQIREIMRQKGDYRQIVACLSEGQIADAFQRLDQLGWIREIPSDERYTILANDYLDMIGEGERVQVISPSHAEGAKVSRAIREGMKRSGLLAEADRTLPQLVNANFTEAERRDVSRYDAGDVLVFHQNAKGIRKGARITASKLPIPVDDAAKFQVYHQQQLLVAEGEMLRITRNGRTEQGRRIENGDLVRVKCFDADGNLVTDRGTIARDYGFLAPGYVATSVASQGNQVETVLISQSWDSRGASSAEQLYVSVSRGENRAVIYTDNKQELLQAVRRSDVRLTATDMIGGQMPAMTPDQRPERDREPTLQSFGAGYE